MARYQHLPLYQATYALTRESYRLRIKFPKTLKYDLGTSFCSSSLRCLRLIVLANGRTCKEPVLRELVLEIECIWTYARLLHDFRGLSGGEFKALSIRLADGGVGPRWSADGRHLYFVDFNDGLVRVEARAGDRFDIGPVEVAATGVGYHYDVHPDGSKIVFMEGENEVRGRLLVTVNAVR